MGCSIKESSAFFNVVEESLMPSSLFTKPTTPVIETEKKYPRGYKTNRRPDLSEEERLAMRHAELVGKIVTGVIIQTKNQFFLRWNRRRTDTVYISFSELERLLGMDQTLWKGPRLTCTITALGPSTAPAYKQHPSSKEFELAPKRKPLSQVRQQQSRPKPMKALNSVFTKTERNFEASWRRDIAG